jgi:hypothetical protein
MTEDQGKLVEHMLSALESPHKELTDWETDFIGSVSDQYSLRRSLSDRQIEILERIYTEKTP